MGALEVDVELVAAVDGPGDEGRARLLVEAGEHRVGGVGLLLVGEVQARDDLVQQPAGEDGEVDVGGLRRLVVAPATGPGLRVRMAQRPSSSVPERPKPRKSPPNAPAGSACQLSTSASGTGSPAPSNTLPRSQTAPGVPSGTT